MRHPVDKVFITQRWGLNPQIYGQFGLKGHNGTDYRLHDGYQTKIYSPHAGKVLEARLDAKGYGWYIKIENEKEGSILAHLKEGSLRVGVGDEVKEGDWLAYGGNTGFSTGPHLHWGYYPKPRQRDNGYSGTVDQIPILESIDNGSTPPDNNNDDSGGSDEVEKLPKDSVIGDVYMALTGERNQSDIDFRMEEGKNIQQIIEDICGGDERFYNKWVKPHVEKSLLDYNQTLYSSIIGFVKSIFNKK